MKQQEEWKPDLVKDWINVLHIAQFVVHAAGWPFRLLWTVPGSIGRRAYGLDCLAGLIFAYPAFGQSVTDPADGRLFMRLWAGLWWYLVIHAVMSHLLNRRWGIHSREIGAKRWVPGGTWPIVALIFVAYFFLRPSASGLGNFLTYSPACYLASNWLVDLKQDHAVVGVTDAEIEGREFQRRLDRG